MLCFFHFVLPILLQRGVANFWCCVRRWNCKACMRGWRNRGCRMGLGPPHLYLGSLSPTFFLNIISLSNTISIGSNDKVNRNEKYVAEFSQYVVDVVFNILFVIWHWICQDFVIVWQNTPCTVYHPAMDCLPHWGCWTVLPDGVNTTQFFIKMVSFYMLVCMGVGRNFSRGGTKGFFQKFFYWGQK